ncbi:MAG: helix-turn-helix domain-containing protein [Ktedonobacteraceae bacterium]
MSTEWLTVESIARELAINIDTVRSWIRQKKLKAYKVGRDYRIKREDYNKFLEERANIQDNKVKE